MNGAGQRDGHRALSAAEASATGAGMLDRLAIAATLWLVLLFGVTAGEATDDEAAIVLAARSAGGRPLYTNRSVDAPFTTQLLAAVQRHFSVLVTVEHARMVCVGALAAAGFIAVGWSRAVLCRSAAMLALAFAAFSAPVFVLSTAASDNAWLFLLGVAAARGLASAGTRPTGATSGLARLWNATIGLASVLGIGLLLAQPKPAVTWDDRILAALKAVACGLPSGLAAGACTRGLLRTLPGIQKTFGSVQWAMVAFGIVLSLAVPGYWPAGGALVVAGLAGLAALVWHRWLDGSIDPTIRRRHERMVGLLCIGIPTVAVLAATARIASVYQFMERVQAIVVVGVGSLAVAIWLVRRRLYAAAWLPVLAVAVAIKCTYVTAYRPEQDMRRGVRALAAAVRARLPGEAVVASDLALGAAFEYYLDAPLVRPHELQARMGDGHGYVLLYEEELQKPDAGQPQRRTLVRVFEGPYPRRLALAR